MYYVSVWPSSFFLGFFFLLMFPSSLFTWTVSDKVSGNSSRAGRGAGGPLVLLRLLGEAGNEPKEKARREGAQAAPMHNCNCKN